MNATALPSGATASPGASCSDSRRWTTRASPPSRSTVKTHVGPALLSQSQRPGGCRATIRRGSSRHRDRGPGFRARPDRSSRCPGSHPARRARSRGSSIRAVEQQPPPVRRPARPAGFGAASQETDAPRLSAAALRGAQPDVVRLILVGVVRDPLPVGDQRSD